MISVVIPVRNAARTLEVCLGAACAAAAACGGEVVVADDGSTDDSAAIAARHPCRVVRPPQGARGAGAARNAGARAARGGTLFFTDADCVLGPDTLALAAGALAAAGPRAVVGGTYASRAFDRGFFPDFQAAFVHFHETRRPDAPDYLATHALAISAVDFRDSGGFPEAFLPILEDVEFSHRLRRAGWRLRMAPAVQVRHSFGFDLAGSLRNAARKTRHWTRYSIGNRDLLADSGTASRGLKAACALWGLALAALATAALARSAAPLLALPVLLLGGLAANAGLVRAFFAAGGPAFGAGATLYLLLVYPAAIAVGAAQALVDLARRGGP